MNNSISSSRDQQLLTWYQIISDCKEAKALGITVPANVDASKVHEVNGHAGPLYVGQ